MTAWDRMGGNFYAWGNQGPLSVEEDFMLPEQKLPSDQSFLLKLEPSINHFISHPQKTSNNEVLFFQQVFRSWNWV